MQLVAQVAQEVSMPQRLPVRKLAVAKAFTGLQAGAFGSPRGSLRTACGFEGENPQKSRATAERWP